VINRPEDLTAEWLTAILRAADAEAKVRSLTVEPIGTGQTGASFRLHLDGDHVPTTLVAKTAAGDRAARERVAAGYRNEVGFYTEFRDRVRIRTPRCWHAEISADACSFVLLLDDLAPARPGVQADGCTVDQAADAVRNLAGLPGPVWNDRSLCDQRAWLTAMTGERAAFLGGITEGAAERFLARYGPELGDDAETLRRAAALTGRWVAIDTGVEGLVHGDYRLDNLMFPEHGDGVVALDWQTLAIGPPGRDLAYFLATSVLVDDRREHESALVAEYLDELRRIGVEDYSFDQCFADYRLGVLQGPMITMIGWAYATATPSASADAMFLAMATRSCAALRDLGSLELVERA
jgi:Phosphotransferase enzyme family